MFAKADGSAVWLRTAGRLPYIAINGRLESDEAYDGIRRRLTSAFTPVSGMCAGDAFLVGDVEGMASLLFCAQRDKSCAMILLGSVKCMGDRPESMGFFSRMGDQIDEALSAVRQHAGVQVCLEELRCEISSHE